ncbi:MAG: VWA domain-containing protein [Hymenobacteraceae bacterium]|nr:VWA domain-containing protein [Hymenobacteraceae bacterium]
MPPEASLDWLRPEWFGPTTLAAFEWAHRSVLYGIPAVALLFGLRTLFAWRSRPHLDLALLPGPDTRPTASRWLRFVPDAVLATALGLVLVALARPQLTSQLVEQTSTGLDILLVLDTSASMQLPDLTPTRLEAAKRTAREFVRGRFHDRIGLVVFAGEAYSLCPLTTDYALLLRQLDGIRPGLIAADGTAIGSALGVAVNRLRLAPTRSRVCILLSDGENTAGQLAPETAAQLARSFGIRLYTVGLGADGPVAFGVDSLTGTPRIVETRLDETAMRQLARIGNGRFFRATDQASLSAIFRQLDQLTKSPLRQTRFRDTRDFYPIYLRWAIVCLLGWFLLKSSFMTSALED